LAIIFDVEVAAESDMCIDPGRMDAAGWADRDRMSDMPTWRTPTARLRAPVDGRRHPDG
jgi:hypothetical protein